jgi:hypothetical protein
LFAGSGGISANDAMVGGWFASFGHAQNLGDFSQKSEKMKIFVFFYFFCIFLIFIFELSCLFS